MPRAENYSYRGGVRACPVAAVLAFSLAGIGVARDSFFLGLRRGTYGFALRLASGPV